MKVLRSSIRRLIGIIQELDDKVDYAQWGGESLVDDCFLE